MIHEQITGDRGYPSREGAPFQVVGVERFIHLYEDILRKIFGLVCGTGEAIANVVDAAVVLADDIFPGGCIAGHAATDKSSNELGVLQPALPGTPGFARL